MAVRIIDCPSASAPTPFEPSPLRYFVYRTAGGFSRLGETRGRFAPGTLDAHFPMGYTNLWVMRRELLRANGKDHRYGAAPTKPIGPYGGAGATGTVTKRVEERIYLFGDDGSKLDYHYDRQGQWVLGFAALDEALESLAHPDIAGAGRIVVATLLEDLYWH